MKKSNRRICGAALAFAFSGMKAQAAVVGVIDSGLDVKHPVLQQNVWVNPGEWFADRVDNDGNGYKDDINGWNFVGNNNELVESKFKRLYDPAIVRFFTTQAAALEAKASPEDLNWIKEVVKDRKFVKKLMTFGNYAHGTHVTGIVVKGDTETKALMAKLIPTENPLASVLSDLSNDVAKSKAEGKPINWIVKEVIKGGLGLLARAQGMIFGQVGLYLASVNADVANASLGMGRTQAEMLVRPLLKLARGGQEPSADEVQELVLHLLRRVNIEQEVLLRSAPNTLFVFAAGNEGGDNDVYPTAPASIQHPFKISVAATFADGRLAPFSNYGRTSVDIAAPGVGIDSTIPDGHTLAMSGTSQAAPLVAGIAAQVKERNPELGPSEIKTILLQTVDRVEALADRVRAGGVLNSERALRAATLSQTLALSAAIRAANSEVGSALTVSLTPPVAGEWIAVPEIW